MYNAGVELLYCTTMIERIPRKELKTLLGEYPIVTILGPRQSGKTTLARQLRGSRNTGIIGDTEGQKHDCPLFCLLLSIKCNTLY